MCRERVPPGRGHDQPVVLAAHLLRFRQHILIQSQACLPEFILAPCHACHHLRHGFPVPQTPCAAEGAEVIHGRNVIIAQHKVCAYSFRSDRLFIHELKVPVLTVTYILASRHVQVSPVHGDMIPGMSEHTLLRLPAIGHLQVPALEFIPYHGRHALPVKAQVQGRGKPQGHIMRLPVQRCERKVHKSDGRGKHIQVIRQSR